MSLARIRVKIAAFMDDCFMVATPLPSAPMFAAGNIGAASFNGTKDILVTSCDVLRSLCKPVDDLAGRTDPRVGYGGSYGYSYPRPVTTYRPAVPAPTATPSIADIARAAYPSSADPVSDLLMGLAEKQNGGTGSP